MTGITINNSKFKNTGVLYESLVRQITADILSGNNISPALSILEQSFNVKTELGKELQLYQAFIENTQKLSESRAVQYLDMIIAQRKKINDVQLAKEKFELIREIKKSYDLKEFFACKIPTYKLYASIFKTFLTEARCDKYSIINLQDVASARFTLIEHLIKNNTKQVQKTQNALIEEFKNQTEDLRLLTYKMLIDNFNQKYDNLDIKQKELLREFINDVSGTSTLVKYVHKELPSLISAIKTQAYHVSDKVIQIKLNEVVSQLQQIQASPVIKENQITAMLIGLEIQKEMERGN